MINSSMKSTGKKQQRAMMATPSGSGYFRRKSTKYGVSSIVGLEKDSADSYRIPKASPTDSGFKYVVSDVDKNGNRRWYVRRPKHRKVRMPCGPHEPKFQDAYDQCFAGLLGPKPRFTKKPPNAFKIGEAIEYGLKKARHRAKELGREFDLTEDWCLQQIEARNFCCAVSGVPFFHKPRGKSKCDPYAPSIDRIDCSRGYTQDNCRIVLFAVNVMLFDWGEDVLRIVARSYRYNQMEAP